MSTYEPIASQTLGSAASSVVFSSIPQNYTDLVIIGAVKNTANNGDEVAFQLNGDTTSSYSRTRLFGNGSSAASGRASNQTKGALAINSTAQFSTVIANFQNYSNGATFKTVLSRGSDASNYVSSYVSLWRNTSPITQITLLPDSGTTFTADSTFTIYGVAAGNSSAKASGGNIVTTDGSYWYHTFTSSGTFIPNEALTADYLVVAGGGAGGSTGRGGGGGAGGYRTSIGGSTLSLSSNTVYQALVGAGGAGLTSAGPGNSGTNSIFSTITSSGGGGGGQGNPNGANGIAGGSGGGGGSGNNLTGSGGAGNAGSYSPVEGYAGGSGSNTANAYGSGGGGGSSVIGGSGSGTNGGNGGNGTANSISGTSITYAGGGGGAVNSGTNGTGGTGGGGAGGTVGVAGTANTGGGGGGTGGSVSGSGGSGVIIIRYAV
jgi:hypothetical protein